MTTHAVAHLSSRIPHRAWATASVADSADTTPMELSALGAHVDSCNGSRGRMFALQCVADGLLGFIAPRFITTAVIVVFVFGIASLVA
ncbi:MAG: hypothetical protein ABI364_06515 [Caldimonas sp.]